MKQWTSREILGLANAHWPPFVLHSGVSLDLFTILDNAEKRGEKMTVAALAKAASCNERALGMLVTALVSLDFLGRDGDMISLPEHSRVSLSQNSEQYVGFIIKHHTHISPAWAKLTEAVKTGSPTREVSSSHTDDAAEREAFLLGMFNVAIHQAETIAAALDLSGKKRLLDLGGGPGTYAVFFCRANPGLRATVFDKPTSEPIAAGIIRRYALEDRIDFVGGDFLKDPLPQGYDVVWISQILHGDCPEDAARLVKEAGKIINPGGLLIVQDFVMDNDKCGPEHPALFALNMLAGTEGGQTYTWAEIESMIRDAGAVSVQRLEVELAMGCGILVGQMPG